MKCQSVVQELRTFGVKVTSDCHVSKASGQVALFILLGLLAALIQLMASPLVIFLNCRTPHSLEFPSMSMTVPS